MKAEEVDRIIEMAWEDRTPFEAIEYQFGMKEKEVSVLMRKHLKESSFKLWRKRVNEGISQKHAFKRNQNITRFKSNLQRTITLNK
ncbi:TIGR03643 family protein, partial [Acinetobacter baumannii]